MVTIFSSGYFFLRLSVKALPVAKLSSSTLQTIILGLILNKPSVVKNFFSNSSFKITSLPSFNCFNFSSSIFTSFS